jgi:hypothetical protein
MNKHLKLLGTQGFSLCVIALAALFIFTFVSCHNDTTSPKPALDGTVELGGDIEKDEGGNFVMVGGQIIAVTEDEDGDSLLTGSGKISYQWQSSDNQNTGFKNITGKTGQAIDADNDLAGKWIKVSVSRANNSGRIINEFAVEVRAGVNDLEGTVEIPKTIKKNEMIYLIDWNDPDYPLGNELFTLDNQEPSSKPTFQWQVSDNATGPWINIEFATQSEYQVNDDVGQYIRVVITTSFGNMMEGYTLANSGNVKSNACLVQEADPKVITKFEFYSNDPLTFYKGQPARNLPSINIDGVNLDYMDIDYDVIWELLDGKTSNDTILNTEGYYKTLKIGADETATELKLIVKSALFPDDWQLELTINIAEFITRTVKITGLTGMNGKIMNINVWNNPNYSPIANSSGEITSNEVTFSMRDADNSISPWSTNGQFYVSLSYYDSAIEGTVNYWHTNGAPIEDDLIDNPKFNFSGNTVTIDFTKFALEPVVEPDLDGIKITITGLGSYANGTNASITVTYNNAMLGIWTLGSGFAGISDGEVTINLLDSLGMAGWKGDNGTTCFIKLTIGSFISGPMVDFVYTQGKSLATIGLTTPPYYWDDFYDVAPTYDFLTSGDEEFTINFNQFVDGSSITYNFGF